MTTKKYQVESSDEVARHLGATKSEIEGSLVEKAVLSLLSQGDIDVFKAAEFLDCDPDDLLTPEQEAILAKGIKQAERREVISLDELKEQHSL